MLFTLDLFTHSFLSFPDHTLAYHPVVVVVVAAIVEVLFASMRTLPDVERVLVIGHCILLSICEWNRTILTSICSQWLI